MVTRIQSPRTKRLRRKRKRRNRFTWAVSGLVLSCALLSSAVTLGLGCSIRLTVKVRAATACAFSASSEKLAGISATARWLSRFIMPAAAAVARRMQQRCGAMRGRIYRLDAVLATSCIKSPKEPAGTAPVTPNRCVMSCNVIVTFCPVCGSLSGDTVI